MLKPTPYRAVVRLLEGVGFNAARVPASHVLFSHRASGATVMLPSGNHSRAVAVPLLVSIRRTLDEHGILAREEFEDRLRRAGDGHRASA